MNRLYNWRSYFFTTDELIEKKEKKEKEEKEAILINKIKNINTYLLATEKKYKPVYHGAKNLPSDFVRIPPNNRYIDPDSKFFPAPTISDSKLRNNPINIALREYFARINKERGAPYKIKDLYVHPDIRINPDYITTKRNLDNTSGLIDKQSMIMYIKSIIAPPSSPSSIKNYEHVYDGAKNLPSDFVRIPPNNRYIDPNSEFFPIPTIDRTNPTNVAMREYFAKINQERVVPKIDTNPTNIAMREYFARMNKERGAPYNKKDLIIHPDISLDPDYIKAKISLGIKHYEPDGAKNLPSGFIRIPHMNKYDPNSEFFPAPTIDRTNPINIAMREYFAKINQERGVPTIDTNPTNVAKINQERGVKPIIKGYNSSDLKKYINDINKINLKSRKISKNKGVNLISEFIRSPKRRSPKRHSPKRRSPKRRSPKRHSPKRRSPKRH